MNQVADKPTKQFLKFSKAVSLAPITRTAPSLTEWQKKKCRALIRLGAALQIMAVSGEDALKSLSPQQIRERIELSPYKRRLLGEYKTPYVLRALHEAFPCDPSFWRKHSIPTTEIEQHEHKSIVLALEQLVEQEKKKVVGRSGEFSIGQMLRIVLEGHKGRTEDLSIRFRKLLRKQWLACLPEQHVRSTWSTVEESFESKEDEYPSLVDVPIDESIRQMTIHKKFVELWKSWQRSLTPAEYRAIEKAINAVLTGECHWHSRRGNALSFSLTEAEGRAFQRACQKDKRIRDAIKTLSEYERREWGTSRLRGKSAVYRRILKESPNDAAGLRELMAVDAGIQPTPGQEGERVARKLEAWLGQLLVWDLHEGILFDPTPSSVKKLCKSALLAALWRWPEGGFTRTNPLGPIEYYLEPMPGNNAVRSAAERFKEREEAGLCPYFNPSPEVRCRWEKEQAAERTSAKNADDK